MNSEYIIIIVIHNYNGYIICIIFFFLKENFYSFNELPSVNNSKVVLLLISLVYQYSFM